MGGTWALKARSPFFLLLLLLLLLLPSPPAPSSSSLLLLPLSFPLPLPLTLSLLPLALLPPSCAYCLSIRAFPLRMSWQVLGEPGLGSWGAPEEWLGIASLGVLGGKAVPTFGCDPLL